MPTWSDLVQGALPPALAPLDDEPGENKKGWQRIATKHREVHHYDHYVSSLDPSARARLRSSAGPNTAR